LQYDFDRIIDRKDTDSIKYDLAKERGKPEGILPLWVADMDFTAPACVIDALVNKSRHGIFGYSETRDDYYETLRDWFLKQFNWNVQPDWIVKTPGVVFAIYAAIRALTDEGDAVLIQQPVYSPFSSAVLVNRRKLVISQLVYSQGKYTIDFSDFEHKIIRNNVKLFILCSPHNPVGRVWTGEELVRLGEICLRYGVIVVSDEIHADFTYPGHRHLVFADVRPEFSEITVTCTAPTKTFNLAGLQISNIFIENMNIRRRFIKEISKTGYSHPNIMGIVACRAAYAGGSEWLIELKEYLSGNLDLLRNFLKQKLPQIKLVEPEGTYLAWLDFSALGIKDSELENLIVNHARLWLDSGTKFGSGGEGFQRINIACPRSILKKALDQLEQAITLVL
jgi:cystathionine beta-lyase